MRFSIEERIHLASIFPESHSYQVIRAIEDFRPKIGFTEEETRKYDIEQKVENNMWHVVFNKEVSEGYYLDLKVPVAVRTVVKEILEEMSQSKKINRAHLSLYEKFVLGRDLELEKEESKKSKPNTTPKK